LLSTTSDCSPPHLQLYTHTHTEAQGCDARTNRLNRCCAHPPTALFSRRLHARCPLMAASAAVENQACRLVHSVQVVERVCHLHSHYRCICVRHNVDERRQLGDLVVLTGRRRTWIVRLHDNYVVMGKTVEAKIVSMIHLPSWKSQPHTAPLHKSPPYINSKSDLKKSPLPHPNHHRKYLISCKSAIMFSHKPSVTCFGNCIHYTVWV
jgi:hypothetical protein